MNRTIFVICCCALIFFGVSTRADTDLLWGAAVDLTKQANAGQLSLGDYEHAMLGLVAQATEPELLGKIYWELAEKLRKPRDGVARPAQYETYARTALQYPLTLRDPRTENHLFRRLMLYSQLAQHLRGRYESLYLTEDWPWARYEIATVLLQGIQASLDAGFPVDPRDLRGTERAIAYGDSGLSEKAPSPELEAKRQREVARIEEHNRLIREKGKLAESLVWRLTLELQLEEILLRTYQRTAPVDPVLHWPEQDVVSELKAIASEVLKDPEMVKRLVDNLQEKILSRTAGETK